MTINGVILVVLVICLIALIIFHRTKKRERLVMEVRNNFPKEKLDNLLSDFESCNDFIKFMTNAFGKVDVSVENIVCYKIGDVKIYYKKKVHKMYFAKYGFMEIFDLPVTDINIKFGTDTSIEARFIDETCYGRFHYEKGLSYINFVQGSMKTTFIYNGRCASEIQGEDNSEFVTEMPFGKLIIHTKLDPDEEFYKVAIISLKDLIEKRL